MKKFTRFARTQKLFILFIILLLGLAWGSWHHLDAQPPKHWGGTSLTTNKQSNQLTTGMTLESLSGVPCTLGFAGPYPCKNVDLLAYLPINGIVGSTGADIWGWTDPATGKEYAIMSQSNAVSFVDVSDPTNPVFLGHLPAPVPNLLWRDVKVYNNHAYIVGDGDFIAPHGLQIFDLTRLRNLTVIPTIFTETARYGGVGNTHNIAINEETGVAYLVGSNTCSGGPHMVGLQDPVNPVSLGCVSSDGYTHDTQCVVYRGPDSKHQGQEICFSSNEDTLTIVDVTNKSTPAQLSRTGYSGHGYTHQGWLTEDQAYFVLGDELDELNNGHNTHSYIWDVRDLDAPVHINTYVGPTPSIDHNLYIRGNFVYQSNYTSGLRILDAGNIANGNLTEVAYFDTHPADDAPVFAGTWSNYPFFKSGIVIVSNIEDGLYVLKPNLPGSEPEPEGGGKTTGGGWLASNEGKKLNFGFSAEETADGFTGDLQLNDKSANVQISIDHVTAVGSVTSDCGGVTANPDALEFRGNGTYNGGAAEFRVCVEDNGEPGKGNDRFYLTCLSGCSYNTGGRTPDSVLDGGNIQVAQAGDAGDPAEPTATTMILDPVLLTEGLAGEVQVFTVSVYAQNQTLLAGAPVTLTRAAADGSTETLAAVTDLTGTAVFSVVNLNQTAEYIATSDSAESNAVEVSSLLP